MAAPRRKHAPQPARRDGPGQRAHPQPSNPGKAHQGTRPFASRSTPPGSSCSGSPFAPYPSPQKHSLSRWICSAKGRFTTRDGTGIPTGLGGCVAGPGGLSQNRPHCPLSKRTLRTAGQPTYGALPVRSDRPTKGSRLPISRGCGSASEMHPAACHLLSSEATDRIVTWFCELLFDSY